MIHKIRDAGIYNHVTSKAETSARRAEILEVFELQTHDRSMASATARLIHLEPLYYPQHTLDPLASAQHPLDSIGDPFSLPSLHHDQPDADRLLQILKVSVQSQQLSTSQNESEAASSRKGKARAVSPVDRHNISLGLEWEDIAGPIDGRFFKVRRSCSLSISTAANV